MSFPKSPREFQKGALYAHPDELKDALTTLNKVVAYGPEGIDLFKDPQIPIDGSYQFSAQWKKLVSIEGLLKDEESFPTAENKFCFTHTYRRRWVCIELWERVL